MTDEVEQYPEDTYPPTTPAAPEAAPPTAPIAPGCSTPDTVAPSVQGTSQDPNRKEY